MAAIDIAGGAGSSQFVSGDYLSAYSDQNYSLDSPNAIEKLEYNNTVLSNGISIDPFDLSKIVFSNAGIYNLQFSCQVLNSSVQNHEFYLWLCRMGLPEIYTNSIITIPSTHGGIDGHFIAAWNFVFSASAGEFFNLCWSGNNTAISIETLPSPAAGIPASPSVILTVQQV
jgi:hypothetical protein